MENHQDLPFREPALKWTDEPLPFDEPFPETEPSPGWNWELKVAAALLVALIGFIASHSVTVLTGSTVRYSFEITMAYAGLGLAATTLTAMTLLLNRRKSGLLLTTLPLSFLAGSYLPASFFILYRLISGEVNGGLLLSGPMLLEFLVPLVCIGLLSLLCSPRSRATLQVSSRSLAVCLLLGLGLGIGYSGLMLGVY